MVTVRKEGTQLVVVVVLISVRVLMLVTFSTVVTEDTSMDSVVVVVSVKVRVTVLRSVWKKVELAVRMIVSISVSCTVLVRDRIVLRVRVLNSRMVTVDLIRVVAVHVAVEVEVLVQVIVPVGSEGQHPSQGQVACTREHTSSKSTIRFITSKQASKQRSVSQSVSQGRPQ